MAQAERIWVYWPEELVDYWTAVWAEPLHGNVYRILDRDYDPEWDRWEFLPGEIVEVEMLELSRGLVPVAVRLAPAVPR